MIIYILLLIEYIYLKAYSQENINVIFWGILKWDNVNSQSTYHLSVY